MPAADLINLPQALEDLVGLERNHSAQRDALIADPLECRPRPWRTTGTPTLGDADGLEA